MRGPLHDRLGEDFFRQVPSTPGVYLMLDDGGGLLYVGKAKNLRTRLRSYSRITTADDDRLVLLVSAVRAIKWEECPDDELAVARETELLRAMRPPFNFTHAAASEYLSIAVARRSGRLRLRLTSDDAQEDETRYGCFAFAAATPDSYKALTRLLFLAQAGAASRVPAGLARAAGYEFDLAPRLQRSVHDYLAGRSSRLLPQLQELIEANHSGEILVQRAAARDLEALEAFFALGPHALRRLQRRHSEGFGPVTAAELTTMLAREMGDQTGVKVQRDPTSVTQRIAELRDEGLGFRALARRLNAEGVPRLRGSGRWRAVDVAELLRPNLRQ